MVEEKDLWEHQKRCIHAATEQKDLALFLDAGVGKTAIAINILRNHFRISKTVKSTLILAPIVVLKQWKDEFAKFSNIPQHQIFVCYGTGAKRTDQIKDAIASTLGDCIIITNYETILMTPAILELLNWRPEIFILDESHRCKSPTSKRSRKAMMIADRAKHKYLLTGTPMTNSPMDIYSQYRIMDGGETFGDNFYVFRSIWFDNIMANTRATFPKFVMKPGKVEEMNRLIYKKAMRAVKSECLDLPPLIKTKIEVPLSQEQKRLYNEMRMHFITYVDSDHSDQPQAVIASQAMVKALRMQQIVTGFVKTEEGETIRVKDNPRIKALKELLEDLCIGHKVIVWNTFKENYAQVRDVCKELKLEYAELHGDITDKQGQVESFRNDPKVRVMIAHPQAGGIGVNLVEASYMIYYSKGFNLEQDIQSEARNFRAGSERHDKITRIDLVSPGTIDELVNEALENKQNIIENIMSLRNQLDLDI